MELKTKTLVCNTHITMNRGRPRLWLDGEKLTQSGFTPGTVYTREIKDEKLVCRVLTDLLTPSNVKLYTVTGHKKKNTIKPVIDIVTKKLAELPAFSVKDKKIRIFARNGVIVASTHIQDDRLAERLQFVLDSLDNDESLRVDSLYHGAGILDSAFHVGMARHGIDTKIGIAVEMEKDYLDTSLRNNLDIWDTDSTAIESPIEVVSFADYGNTRSHGLLAGIPCTGAGLGARSSLGLTCAEEHPNPGVSAGFIYTLDAIRTRNHAFAVFENVALYAKSDGCHALRSVLNVEGYDLHEIVLKGRDFGAIENRSRWIMTAVTKGLSDFIDLDSIIYPLGPNKPLSCVLENVPYLDPAWKTYQHLEDKAKRDSKAGKGFKRHLVTPEALSVNCIGAGYFKARSTEVQLLHPSMVCSRLLTVLEHCAVKMIPNYLISGSFSKTTTHEMLGNSVIYSMIVAVGELFGRGLRKSYESLTIDNFSYSKKALLAA